MQIHDFYKGLTNTSHTLIDASIEGPLIKKNEDEAYELLKGMANNNYLWSSERLPPLKKVVGILEVDAITKLTD